MNKKNLTQDKRTGIWWYQKMVEGERVRISLETKDLSIASAKRNQFNYELAEYGRILDVDEDESKEVITWNELMHTWLSGKKCRWATMDYYERIVKYLSEAPFNSKDASKIVYRDVDALERILWAREGIERDTVLAYMKIARMIYNYGIKMYGWGSNPFTGYQVGGTSTKKEIEWYNQEEVNKLLKAAAEYPNEQVYNYICIRVGTGLRPGEVHALTEEHIDLVGNKVIIRQSIDKFGRVGDPKTPTSKRHVEFGEAVKQALINQIKLSRREGSQYLFYNIVKRKSKHSHFRESNFYDIWSEVIANAGIKYIVPYDMRHTYATTLLRKDLNLLEYVSKQLGHTDKFFTLKVYTGCLQKTADSDQSKGIMDDLLSNTVNGNSEGGKVIEFVR